jgi:hypothetical protein
LGESERNRKTGLGCRPAIRQRFRAPPTRGVQIQARWDSKLMANCAWAKPLDLNLDLDLLFSTYNFAPHRGSSDNPKIGSNLGYQQ